MQILDHSEWPALNSEKKITLSSPFLYFWYSYSNYVNFYMFENVFLYTKRKKKKNSIKNYLFLQ